MDKQELEQAAVADYTRLLGKVVPVFHISGYIGEDSTDLSCSGVVVRILPSPLEQVAGRWMDEWLDPIYEVELVERGNLPEGFRSPWIYGTSRSLTGLTDGSDLIEEN